MTAKCYVFILFHTSSVLLFLFVLLGFHSFLMLYIYISLHIKITLSFQTTSIKGKVLPHNYWKDILLSISWKIGQQIIKQSLSTYKSTRFWLARRLCEKQIEQDHLNLLLWKNLFPILQKKSLCSLGFLFPPMWQSFSMIENNKN